MIFSESGTHMYCKTPRTKTLHGSNNINEQRIFERTCNMGKEHRSSDKMFYLQNGDYLLKAKTQCVPNLYQGRIRTDYN